jgi:hypothetical protein
MELSGACKIRSQVRETQFPLSANIVETKQILILIDGLSIKSGYF